MKIRSLALAMALLSGSALAGWAPVQILDTAANVDEASTGFVGVNDLQWGVSGFVSVPKLTSTPLSQLVQLKRSAFKSGAWVTQSLSDAAWLNAPSRAGGAAAAWIQRVTPFDLDADEDKLHVALLSNGAWVDSNVLSLSNQQILPSEVLSAEQRADGLYQINVATFSGADWLVRAALVNQQGVLQGGNSAVALLDYSGLTVFHNGSVIYSSDNNGTLYSHTLNAGGDAWISAPAFSSDHADLMILAMRGNIAVL
ncbi:MAG TPA: hypothetical protein VFM46_02570, partial [Pseudomonadales bacterium]|nr:hypothetical protein [Pseudomonadales bacterium]